MAEHRDVDPGPRSAAHAEGSLRPGMILENTYRIERALAEGGMGHIYLAKHERLLGTFVVKSLHVDLLEDDEAFSRFRREAQLLSRLHHPNVVQVVDFNVTDTGIPYLVMEYLEGENLAKVLYRCGRLPPAQAVALVRQLASALNAAHAIGVVHRDLKPENVVVVSVPGQSDLVKVIDFGISKTRWGTRITLDAKIVGTPEFMAPEQALGLRESIGPSTDQFALGVLTYLLLVGEGPFRGADPLAILYKIVNEPPIPLDGQVPWRTSEIQPVLLRAMAKSPSKRYPSVLEFANAVERALMSGAESQTAESNGVPGEHATSILRVTAPWEVERHSRYSELSESPTKRTPVGVHWRRKRSRWPAVRMAVVIAFAVSLLSDCRGISWLLSRWG